MNLAGLIWLGTENMVKHLRASVNEGNFLIGCGSFVLPSTALFGVHYGKRHGENERSYIMSNFVVCSRDVMLMV